MLDERTAFDLRAVLHAQRHLVGRAETRLTALETAFADTDAQTAEHAALSADLDGLEVEDRTLPRGLLQAGDLDGWETDSLAIGNLYRSAERQEAEAIRSFGYRDWPGFVRDSAAYCSVHGLETTLPWEALLTDAALERLRQEKESFAARYRWDRWDYAFVGLAGTLAALTDCLLVRVPKTITYAGRVQEGSPVTAFLRERSGQGWFAGWAGELERRCKVPYDGNPLPGMGSRTHRLQSLGHDPILGLVFGVLDIYRGTLSGFSYDRLSGLHAPAQVFVGGAARAGGLIGALLTHLGHLVSDAGTPMGLPAPLFGLFQAINVPVPGSPKGRTVGELARWMYAQGYDLRHFLSMGLVPAVVEIVVRGWIMLRHYAEHGEVAFRLADHPKYRAMLLSAHAIACAGNAGRVALMQGNPLAINYAEWLALLRYLVPSVKHWLFDRGRLELAHLESINEAAWAELLQAGDRLLERGASERFPNVLRLG